MSTFSIFGASAGAVFTAPTLFAVTQSGNDTMEFCKMVVFFQLIEANGGVGPGQQSIAVTLPFFLADAHRR